VGREGVAGVQAVGGGLKISGGGNVATDNRSAARSSQPHHDAPANIPAESHAVFQQDGHAVERDELHGATAQELQSV
jgi:hypothetical protein